MRLKLTPGFKPPLPEQGDRTATRPTEMSREGFRVEVFPPGDYRAYGAAKILGLLEIHRLGMARDYEDDELSRLIKIHLAKLDELTLARIAAKEASRSPPKHRRRRRRISGRHIDAIIVAGIFAACIATIIVR